MLRLVQSVQTISMILNEAVSWDKTKEQFELFTNSRFSLFVYVTMIEKIVKCTAKLQLGGLQSSDILRRPPKICPIFHIFVAISEYPNFNESAVMYNSILIKI